MAKSSIKKKEKVSVSVERPSKKDKALPLVTIGASAGGIEAVTELLSNLSPETGLTYLYIQHLDPSKPSLLTEILSKATKMPVAEVENMQELQRNTLYIIPPGKDIILEDSALKLIERPPKPVVHLPINLFFLSLNEKQKESTIGIILSGTGSDGAIGLKEIKNAGGLTFVQDETAKFESMPKAAIAEGAVDLVLSPKEIASELERLAKHQDIFQHIMEGSTEKEVSDLDEELPFVLSLLKRATSVDFSHYKLTTVKRRVVRRMLLHKLETLSEYAELLRKNPVEINQLYQDLLINVTNFFRDPDTCEYLHKKIFPKIINSNAQGGPIRIWVPACSTGQEAYTIAMIMVDMLASKFANISIQIFATDLSESAVNRARIGIYSKTEVMDVPPKYLERYFNRIDGSFRIVKSIRDICVFAVHNLFRDPPFSKLNLISCCNLLIYLDATLQKKIMATFHYSLSGNGYLILGKSETIGSSTNLFTHIDKKYKVYSKNKETAPRAIFEVNYRMTEKIRPDEINISKKNLIETREVDIDRMVDDLLLAKHVPASVVVNQDMEISQFRGSTGLYLEPSPGRASLNLLKMARNGLGYELRTLIHKARKTFVPVKKSGMELVHKGVRHYFSVEVVQLKTESEEKHFLVLFEDIPPPAEHQRAFSSDERVRQLELELAAVKEDMTSMVEVQEAANEELQSANEEIVSSNEELQSINEELETSKEEIESSNEELITINQELQMRNEQLAEEQEYSEAVFQTLRESSLVLDKQLRIKKANSIFYNTFRLKAAETEGAVIFDLAKKSWDIPALRTLLQDNLAFNSRIDDFELTGTFSGIGEKVLLINARKVSMSSHGQELILLAMEDITEHRQMNRLLTEREAWFRNMADNAPVMMIVFSSDMLLSFVNKTWLDFTGTVMEAELGNGWTQRVHEDDLARVLYVFTENFSKRKPFQTEFRLKRHDDVYRWILIKGNPSYNHSENFVGFIGSCVDIHEQKMTHDELEKRVMARTEELQRSNLELASFSYVASHDLQEPLRKIHTFTQRIQEKETDKLSETAKDYFERVLSATQRMQQLILDLLAYSRTNTVEKKFESTDLNILVNDVLDELKERISETGTKVRVKSLPEIGVIQFQIRQLFTNIITNSIKFARKKVPMNIVIDASLVKGSIVKGSTLNPKKNYWEITVSDNGIGFEAEYSKQIFELFQRLHGKGEYPGTGLGLAICKKIVSNHKGHICATGKPGKGATIKIYLPDK